MGPPIPLIIILYLLVILDPSGPTDEGALGASGRAPKKRMNFKVKLPTLTYPLLLILITYSRIKIFSRVLVSLSFAGFLHRGEPAHIT
jgi:hypothetical protein